MANKDYGQTYYPLDSKGFDAAVDMEQMAESLEGRMVMSFDSTSARDTALASLTTAQKRGVVAHVAGKGWYGYDGSGWKQFSTTLVKGGLKSTVVESNGYARIPDSECFFDGSTPTSIVCIGTYIYDTITFGLYDGGGALVRVINTQTHTQAAAGTAVTFMWIAIKVT